MFYALVRNGVVETIKDLDPAGVPIHKLDIDGGQMLRPFAEEAAPTFTPSLDSATSELIVEKERVRRVWTVTRKPIEEQRAAVKGEARRRILARFPEWKQANMTARAVELVSLETLTRDETDELTALKAIWAWIKSVRAASDAIEALDPIPADYRADARWPA